MKKLLTQTILSALLALSTLGAVPMAHAGAFIDFAENKIADAVMRGQAIGVPATWYIGLDTVACTETGGGTEVTGGSYARVGVAASLTAWSGTQSAGSTTASSGTGATTSNNASVPFATPTAGWGAVQSVRFWDAASAGNAWVCTPLTVPKTINTGDTVSFPAAALTLTIDN